MAPISFGMHRIIFEKGTKYARMKFNTWFLSMMIREQL